jgi:hypothetical protein
VKIHSPRMLEICSMDRQSKDSTLSYDSNVMEDVSFILVAMLLLERNIFGDELQQCNRSMHS